MSYVFGQELNFIRLVQVELWYESAWKCTKEILKDEKLCQPMLPPVTWFETMMFAISGSNH